MAKVSRRILNKELEDYIFELFIKTITDLRDPSEVRNFLTDLLSPIEKIMLVKRLAIAVLLTKGFTYDTIDATLKVSRPTIMNVSRALKHGESGYQQAVKKILEHQKREEIGDKIEEILLRFAPPAALGSASFSAKQQAGKTLFKRRLRRSML